MGRARGTQPGLLQPWITAKRCPLCIEDEVGKNSRFWKSKKGEGTAGRPLRLQGGPIPAITWRGSMAWTKKREPQQRERKKRRAGERDASHNIN